MPLTHNQAKAFYDRFGAKQDKQGFYEDPAIERLIVHGPLKSGGRILEFGCGTGRLAERVLRKVAPPNTSYIGLDISPVMAGLARARLEPMADRAEVRVTDGAIDLPVPSASVDLVVSTYVMDLLCDDDIRRFLQEAWRVLRPGGMVGLVSTTEGTGIISRGIMGLLKLIHRLRPALVGGCRPVTLERYLPPAGWKILHAEVVTAFGISSEVILATRPS